MEIKENKVYKTKGGQYVHIKEITYYILSNNIANIVTGNITEYPSDSVTNVMRKVFTPSDFRDLVVDKKDSNLLIQIKKLDAKELKNLQDEIEDLVNEDERLSDEKEYINNLLDEIEDEKLSDEKEKVSSADNYFDFFLKKYL